MDQSLKRDNPQDPRRHGVEPQEVIVQRNAQIFRSRLPYARVTVIPRVGFDVAASCGMFMDASERRPNRLDSSLKGKTDVYDKSRERLWRQPPVSQRTA